MQYGVIVLTVDTFVKAKNDPEVSFFFFDLWYNIISF